MIFILDVMLKEVSSGLPYSMHKHMYKQDTL